VVDALREAPREPLQLALAHPGGVDLHAALGATEGQVEERRLPGHQGGEGAHLVEIRGGVVADPALVGAPGAVVLHPVAAGHDQVAVVEAHRHLDGDLAVGRREDRVQLLVEVEDGGGLREVLVDRLVGGQRRHARVTPARRRR
jgi:hypothetical protein